MSYNYEKKYIYIQSADKHEGAFIAYVEPQQSMELLKDEEPKLDSPKPQHLVQLQMTKVT